MFCRNCGKEIHDEAVLCVHCGTYVNSAVLPLQTTAISPSSVNSDEKKNGFAIAGFILSFFGVIGWLFSILGLVFSILGLVKSKELKNGKGLGIAGIVISVCAFLINCVIMAFLFKYLLVALLLFILAMGSL